MGIRILERALHAASKHEVNVPLMVLQHVDFALQYDVLTPAAESSFCAYVAAPPGRWRMAVQPQSCSEEVSLLLLCPEITRPAWQLMCRLP